MSDYALAERYPTEARIEAQRILVIDDDADFGHFIQMFLGKNGYDVRYAMSGTEGLKKYRDFHPKLILLDVVMPGMNGFDFCRRFSEISSIPIIFLSSLDEVPTILEGFDCGAVDYVVKPLNPRILLARVKLALRIGSLIAATTKTDIYNDGYLNIDLPARKIKINGEPVHLTTTEFAVLLYLMENAGAPCSVDQILRHVWGDGYRDASGHVYVYIRRLRQKLERGNQLPEYIVGIHGKGYQFKHRRHVDLRG